jgi:hypothetical protein
MRVIILSEARLLDTFKAFYGDDIGQFRIAVTPEGVGQEPVGVDPGGATPDEPAGVSRHVFRVRYRNGG